MLWEGDHPYEYMDGWDTFSETSLSEKKKEFYSNLTRSSSQKITTNMPKESVKTLDLKI